VDGHRYQDGGEGDTARCIVYRALSEVNTNAAVTRTGWEGPKDKNRNNLEGAARSDNPKKQEKNVQKKDVEEGIKMCDGIVERREKKGNCVWEKHLWIAMWRCEANLGRI
jgi:hypothetical protein